MGLETLKRSPWLDHEINSDVSGSSSILSFVVSTDIEMHVIKREIKKKKKKKRIYLYSLLTKAACVFMLAGKVGCVNVASVLEGEPSSSLGSNLILFAVY